MAAGPYTLAADGDLEERRYWPLFVRHHFPSYEEFWAKRIVPLTNRTRFRQDVSFQSSSELNPLGYADEDVAVAQLHYTLLLHLGRVFDLLTEGQAFTHPTPLFGRPFGRHEFFESFTRLSGENDVADEILARRQTPGSFDAWSEKHGSNARTNWRQTQGDPLRPIRAYRNRLVHGRVVPEYQRTAVDSLGDPLGTTLFYPRIEHVNEFLDWREAFRIRALPGPGSAVVDSNPPSEFTEGALIVRDAWEQVIGYVEGEWRAHLLPTH